MKYLIGQLVRAERMGEDSNYLQVEGAVTGHKNGFTLIKAICVRDRYSKEWSMHPTSCACAAKDKDITQIERLSFEDPSQIDPHATAALLAFDVEADKKMVQPWIRMFVREFISDHKIRGLSDPMYYEEAMGISFHDEDAVELFSKAYVMDGIVDTSVLVAAANIMDLQPSGEQL